MLKLDGREDRIIPLLLYPGTSFACRKTRERSRSCARLCPCAPNETRQLVFVFHLASEYSQGIFSSVLLCGFSWRLCVFAGNCCTKRVILTQRREGAKTRKGKLRHYRTFG